MRSLRQQIGKGVVLSLFFLGVGAFFYFDLARWLTLDQLKLQRGALQHLAQVHGVWTVIVYILLYILQTALSLPVAAIFTLAGGFLFGSLWGTLYVNIGATLGSTLALLSARYLIRDMAEKKMGPWFQTICRGVEKHPFSYLLTLRLSALFPFFLINLAFGLTPIRILPFMAATSLGIIPITFVIAHAGQKLGSVESLEEIFSPSVLVVFLLFGLLALAPVIYRKIKPSITGARVAPSIGKADGASPSTLAKLAGLKTTPPHSAHDDRSSISR